MAYFGTNKAYEIENAALSGDAKAELMHSAMAYQISKEIGALATVTEGEVDGILLTGGVAHGEYIVSKIRKRTEFIAPVFVYPGEDELRSLAMNGYRVMTGQVEALEY
jgi:butyrate kinase